MPSRSAEISPEPDDGSGRDFIRDLVVADLASARFAGRVQTRFPPEPNGYLHIGHAKAICLDFTVASEFGGRCVLRFDDTNPATESPEYVDAIVDDVRWLGFEPHEIRYASDYFEQLYAWAELLIERGLAYVDDQDADAISAGRGGFGRAGTESPYRDRPASENLRLFREMAAGRHPEGSRVLRARVDMQHENMQMRDPVMYRIRHEHHYRSGDRWCIYPTYDWAHGQSDAIEGVTHSLCTLEFRDNRALYDWYLEHLPLGELGLTGERPLPDRVHPAGAEPDDHLQADPAPAGGERPYRRLGRSQAADAASLAAARVSPCSHPGVLRLYRGCAHQQPPCSRTAGIVRADGAECRGASPYGRTAAAEARHHQLAR